MPDALKRGKQTTVNSTNTLRRTFVMDNPNGLHARPAALLVKIASKFHCEITAHCGGELASAKSVLGLLGLAAGPESKVTFTATGVDAPVAISAIQRLFEQYFGEACMKAKPAFTLRDASDSKRDCA